MRALAHGSASRSWLATAMAAMTRAPYSGRPFSAQWGFHASRRVTGARIAVVRSGMTHTQSGCVRAVHTTSLLRNACQDASASPATVSAADIYFTFRNADGAAVRVTLSAIAGQLKDESRHTLPDILLPPEGTTSDEAQTPEWARVQKAPMREERCSREYTLACSEAALNALKEYIDWPKDKRHTDALPKPLEAPLSAYITPDEEHFLHRVDEQMILMELLEAALSIHHDSLAELCAAYASVRVDEIAKEAPNIMEGAERIRKYLGLKNEWTAEEMKHLENEMKVIKELDPSAY